MKKMTLISDIRLIRRNAGHNTNILHRTMNSC